MAMSNVGSFVTNFHEGSRSEYLAQYVFSGFGTSVPILHQEDTGFDLFATLTERRGRISWPLYHYTVQVKSSAEPWEFPTSDSVKWLLRHPHPLFLCVLDKKSAHFSLYHAFPRFKIWTLGKSPQRVVFEPGPRSDDGYSAEWDWPDDGETFTLGGPILDYSIEALADSATNEHAKKVLESWLRLEVENLACMQVGLPVGSLPHRYWTNALASESGGLSSFWNTAAADIDALKPTLRRILPWLAEYFRAQNDLRGMARSALLVRYLETSVDRGMDTPPLAYRRISELVSPGDRWLAAGVDTLGKLLDDAIESYANGGTARQPRE
jgi:hypothetical protein